MVPLHRPYPFGIAKVLSCDAEGNLSLQWMGNAKDDVYGTYLPGWLTTVRRNAYYAESPKAPNHAPYMTTEDDEKLIMNQRDVLMHSFDLTPSQRLPAALLRAIARHPNVWWDPNAAED